ncbi:MAG: VOC family protein [Gaiellaceae bacterium]|jgi:predicted enzyme related to lactoylglutathione lyase
MGGPLVNPPLLRNVDCIRLAVDDLDAAIGFYERLGQKLIWRRPVAADLRLPESNTELVLQAEEPGIEVDFLVDDAERAVERFVAAGGTLVGGPFEIEIGRCAVVADLWQNTFVLLDMSRGPLPETRVQDEAGTGGNG